jgi:hypothetical protein
VVAAESPHALVWRTVARAPYLDSVEWRLSLSEYEGGTRINESFQVLAMPWLMERALWLAMPAHRDRSADLVEDLERLRSLVELAARNVT